MDRKKLLRRIVVAAIVILTVYAGYTVIVQQIALYKKDQELIQLQKQLEELQAKKEELANKIQSSDDPEYIQTLAREKLNWVKKNEIIFMPSQTIEP